MKNQKKKERRPMKATFETAAPTRGTIISIVTCPVLLSLVGLVPCYPVCHFLPIFVHRSFPSIPPAPPPYPHSLGRIFCHPSCPPLNDTHGGGAALPPQLVLILESPHHEWIGCFEDPPVPIPRICCCGGPQRGLNSKHQGGKFR